MAGRDESLAMISGTAIGVAPDSRVDRQRQDRPGVRLGLPAG